MLMKPINDGLLSENWRKRNSAIILSEEMIHVLQKVARYSEDAPEEKL